MKVRHRHQTGITSDSSVAAIVIRNQLLMIHNDWTTGSQQRQRQGSTMRGSRGGYPVIFVKFVKLWSSMKKLEPTGAHYRPEILIAVKAEPFM